MAESIASNPGLTISGTYVADTIVGGFGDDTINDLDGVVSTTAPNGNHILPQPAQQGNNAGNDLIIGLDTVRYFNPSADYAVALKTDEQGQYILIQDRNLANGDDGTDILRNVNYIEFSGQRLATTSSAFDNLNYLFNTAPTDIRSSSTKINENILAGTVVANLSTTDPDAGNIFSYALVTGTGSQDNSAFTISGNQLMINGSPNYETQSSYSIRIQSKDQGGLIFEKNLTISVEQLIQIPAITIAISPTTVTEDSNINLIYTFTRNGPSTSALTLNYNVAGTADSSDYNGATPGIGKTITFLVGASTATLTIDPTADSTVETNETVALTLAAGNGYTLGTTTVVEGTISNDDKLISIFSITPSAGTTNEGSTLTTTVATTNVASGTNLYYALRAPRKKRFFLA